MSHTSSAVAVVGRWLVLGAVAVARARSARMHGRTDVLTATARGLDVSAIPVLDASESEPSADRIAGHGTRTLDFTDIVPFKPVETPVGEAS